jgi:hypothetical protein
MDCFLDFVLSILSNEKTNVVLGTGEVNIPALVAEAKR